MTETGSEGAAQQSPEISKGEAAAHAAADYAEQAGKGAENLTVDQARKKGIDDSSAMFKMMVPTAGGPEEIRKQTEAIESTHLDILTKISEKAVPGSDDPIALSYLEALDIASKLGTLKIGKNQPNIDDFLVTTYPMLDNEAREVIKQNLPDVALDPDELNKSDADKVEDRERNETLKGANERLDEINTDLTSELNNQSTPPTTERREEIEGYQNTIAKLKNRFTGFFAEGEKGRKYARVGGKVAYMALLAAFIIFLIELNLVNKAAKNTGRR